MRIFVFEDFLVCLFGVCVDCFLHLFPSNVVVVFISCFIYVCNGLFSALRELLQLWERRDVKLNAVEFGYGFTEIRISLVLL